MEPTSISNILHFSDTGNLSSPNSENRLCKAKDACYYVLDLFKRHQLLIIIFYSEKFPLK